MLSEGAVMKKVLMIAYHFPPMVSVGVLRTLKFAKYLPRFEWKPAILTVRNPDPLAYKLDPQHMKEKLKDVKVYKSWDFPLSWAVKGLRLLGINGKWFFVPDSLYAWFFTSIFVGKKIIEKEKIDAIYATGPPQTAFLVGAFLKRICNRPLVIDFRDLWINNPFVSYPSKIHYRLERRMEEWVLEQADVVAVVCQSLKSELVQSFPFLNESKIYVISNGFDPDDFDEVTPRSFGKFTILHAGSIYGPRVREFKLLLEAVDHLIHSRSVLAEDFQLIFVGYLARAARKIMGDLNLPNVHYVGVKHHHEIIELMLGSDVLLLIPGASENITAKIFEYLAAGKFILNLSDWDGEASELINEMQVGKTVKTNPIALRDALYEILTLQRVKVKVDSKKLNRFSRFNLTKMLASRLNSVVLKR